MVGLAYGGATPANPGDLLNKNQATTILTSAPVSRTAVSSQINTAATVTYAPKAYIDTQDGQFALDSYYTAQDALNVPLTSVGAPNGVAALDSSGLIPLTQLPALGTGYLLGPFGPTTAVTARTAGSAPLDFTDFAIGAQSIAFQPLVYATVIVSSTTAGRPIIEARMSSGAATYSSQTLVARGMGRTGFTGNQAIALMPVSASTGATPSSYPKTYNIFISLYIRDPFASSTLSTSGLLSASVYLLRLGL